MAKSGGFNHNLQGLRVVDFLEERYPEFPGLNLSWEVREGIVKHSSVFDIAVAIKEFYPKKMPSLETQLVDVADEIAYDNHDLDDGLTSGLIKEADLDSMGDMGKRMDHFVQLIKRYAQKYKTQLELDDKRLRVIAVTHDVNILSVLKQQGVMPEEAGLIKNAQIVEMGVNKEGESKLMI